MNEKFYAKWLKLSNEDRLAVFQETANRKGLPAAAIEKDWWVTITLRVIFNMDVAPHLHIPAQLSTLLQFTLSSQYFQIKKINMH